MVDDTQSHRRVAVERPTTLAEMISALTTLSELPPLERARALPVLIEVSSQLLARERSRAMREVVDGGMSKSCLARELGITQTNLYNALRRQAEGDS
jgi:hypothetical protein